MLKTTIAFAAAALTSALSAHAADLPLATGKYSTAGNSQYVYTRTVEDLCTGPRVPHDGKGPDLWGVVCASQQSKAETQRFVDSIVEGQIELTRANHEAVSGTQLDGYIMLGAEFYGAMKIIDSKGF